MPPKRDIRAEIETLRNRRFSPFARGDLYTRLSQLERLLETDFSKHYDFLKYFPVALIACIEAYTRYQIEEMVDHGAPFIDNIGALELTLTKFDLELLKGIGSRAITLGELTSHLLQISSLEDVNSHFSRISGKDFLAELKTVTDRRNVEMEEAPTLIIEEPADVYAAVKRTFELRHIFAHEFAIAFELDPDEIKWCFTQTVAFLRATAEWSSSMLYPNAPLTQNEMNIQSAEALDKANQDLRIAVDSIFQRLEINRAKDFNAVQEFWAIFRDAQASFEADQYSGGSIRPTIYATTAERLTRDRIDELQSYLGDLDQQ